MGNLESSATGATGLQRKGSKRRSLLRHCRRSESFDVRREPSAINSPKKAPQILRRPSGLSCYLHGYDDALLPRRSPRRPKRANSMRSHSENRRMNKFAAETNSNPESLSQSYSNLRLAMQPQFQITNDLKTFHIHAIRRVWKQELKRYDDSELELANRLLLRIFTIDSRIQAAFHLFNVPLTELKKNALFQAHVKVMEPALTFVMSHLHDATAMSKPLQALGARHVMHTRIQYKSIYWKIVNQALVEFVNADRSSGDVVEAWNVLGNFCAEQMRIGYKIEYKIKKVIQRLENKGPES